MARNKVDLRQVFLPQDSIAFIVIAIGLFIALFLDEMAVRLIGVCIAVLGGVALFMMVSPRLTDLSVKRPPRPTESPSFQSETHVDPLKKSQVFDRAAYQATFGAEDASGEQVVDERQTALFPEMISEAERRTHEQAPSSADLLDGTKELGDGASSVRIVSVRGPKKDRAPEPPLTINSRAAQRAAELQAVAGGSPAEPAEQPTSAAVEPAPRAAAPTEPTIPAVVTEEIQLSDDVIVRPRSADSKPFVPPPTPPAEEPINLPAEEPADESEAAIASESDPLVPAVAASAAARPRVTITLADEEASVPAPAPVSHKRRRSEISVSAFMADEDEEMESSEEPRKEFDYLVNRVLMVIRSATIARTAAFFWYNREKQQLVLEAKITDVEDHFTKKRKIQVGHDVISQIAREGRPEILTQISPAAELDLLPYYQFKANTASFVGVPVYFKGNVVGVLCADAAEEDAYTDVTVGFFGHFTKLISGLVSSYTTKFDLQQAARTLDAMRTFKSFMDESSDTESDVVQALFETAIRLMDVSTIGVCMFDRGKRIWTIADARSVYSDYQDLVGTPIDLDQALIGECIKSGEVLTVTDPDMVRVSVDEYDLRGGQLVCIPLRSARRTYGALYIENSEASLSQQDISIGEQIGDLAGDALERIRSTEQLQQGALLDVGTGLLNKEGVERRLHEEFARSMDYQVPLTVCLVEIDGSIDASRRQVVLDRIIERIREQIRDYDVVGRYNEQLIAIGLVAYRAQEAQFWAENLRREIASTPIEVDGKRITSTISIGLAEARPSESWESLIANATTALEASARQQNKVTVFS